MSQLVRLEGKHSTQNAHCALVGRHTDKPKAINILMIKLVISGDDEEENQT